MSRLEHRLRKIECSRQWSKLEPTREELHVARMIVADAIATSKHSEQIRQRAKAAADKLASTILATAAAQQSEQFENHIRSYVEPAYVARGGVFIPPVMGSEYDDWNAPGLADRRIAIRRCPAVIALIGVPDASLVLAGQPVFTWQAAVRYLFERAGVLNFTSERVRS